MSRKSFMARVLGFTILIGIIGAGAGYYYAKETGAVLGFIIGLFVGNYLDKGR